MGIPHFEDVFIDNSFDMLKIKKFISELNTFPHKVFEKHNISVKYDGRFAVFTGWHDNEFFVSTKKIQNVNPVLFKTDEDINKSNTVPYVKQDLKLCLKYLKDIHENRDAIYQGDFMYNKYDIMIDDQYLSFQPNAVRYGVEKDSLRGRVIRKSKLGVVFHTKFNSLYLGDLSKTKGKAFSMLLNHNGINEDVFVMSPTYKANEYFNTYPRNDRLFNPELLSTKLKYNIQQLFTIYRLPELLKTYINSCYLKSPWYYSDLTAKEKTDNFLNYYKSNRVRGNKSNISEQVGRAYECKDILFEVFAIHAELSKIKSNLLEYLEKCHDNPYKAFIKNHHGFWVKTHGEGYILNFEDDFKFKLVDRGRFHKANVETQKMR